jgi:DNA-binding CsgD family transcriptional regulator/GAF domain-containing protein
MTATGRRNPREPPEAAALRRRLERLEQEARAVQGLLQAHERRRQSDALLKGLLALALADLPLDTMLARFIEALTSLPWLALEQKGAIFLVSEGGGALELKAQRGLGPAMAARCARVPFGCCLCGRAAAGAQILFADHVDHRHDWVYDGMPPHGHYCVPIIGGDGAVRGLITLYLPEGGGRSPDAEEFLQGVADTLAGIVERRTIQLRLAERTRELEARTRELEEANIALGVLVKRMDREKQDLAEQIVRGVREQVLPHVRALAGANLNERQRRRLEVLQSRIADLARPLAQDLAAALRGLSPGEARVARLIMEGLRSKEIALLLNLSPKTVEVHRRNIRRKMGLRRDAGDLRAFLLSRRTP